MGYQIVDGIPVWGQTEENTLAQARNCARFFDHVALMGDNHKGYGAPVGSVVASENKISPSAVGFDIACGNKAVLTDIKSGDIKSQLPSIADDIWKTLSFGVGLNNSDTVDHDLFDDETWKMKALAPLKQTARNQLGTIGSGVCRLA